MDATPPNLAPNALQPQTKDRVLSALKKFSNRLFKALADINSYLAELLRRNRPGVITILTARPYTMIVAVAMLSVLSTLVVTRVVVNNTTNSGPNYRSMQHMIEDIQHSGRTNWNIYSNVSNVSGQRFKITSVESDRFCFRSLPSPDYGDQYLQQGCMFYGHVIFVLPIDNTDDF